MRRARTLSVGACGVMLAACHALAYDGVTQVGATGEAIVAFVCEAYTESGFSGAVLAGRGGKVIAAVAVGEAGDGSGDPLKIDSLFEIASCTKPFTAIAVMRLVEEGKLSLDDPIAEHLPGIPPDCRSITVRHLLQHTSGIDPENSRGRGKDLAKVLPTFLAGGPRTPPGETHAYWNQGYALLSEVIARASGKSYVGYVRESIFKPSKMSASRFTGQRGPNGLTVATGRSSRGASRSAFEHPYGEYGFQYRGMGGLVTNLIDLWRWDRTMAAGKLLSSESLTEMTTAGPGGYALGWRIAELASGEAVHQHTGSVRGFLASIRRNPADDGCLFVLANSDESAPFNLVKSGCEAILEGRKPIQYGKPADDPAIDAETVAALVGVYQDDQGRTLTVTAERRRAKAVINWHGPLTHGWLGLATAEGSAEGGPSERGLLFATGKSYRKKAFASADPIHAERKDGTIVALDYTIAEINKTLRFERVSQ